MSISINSGHSYDDYKIYSQIASGKKIQTAADGPAEKAIIEKGKAQANGYDAGVRNMQDGKSVLNVSEGGLKGINDYLQRIREYAVQAGNTAVVSDSDRKMIQYNIDQMKQGIMDIANNTQYNTKNLLDGSNRSMQIAAGSNGDGVEISAGEATLKALGIDDFDVTKKFSVKRIDQAIDTVNQQRSRIGAQSNGLDHLINYGQAASNLATGSVSKQEDADIAQSVMELKKNQTLQTYSIMMQKKQMENEENKLKTMYM